jgi:hypothetical protein
MKSSLVLRVTAAAYFAAALLEQKLKLRIPCEKVLILSQRLFGIPPFRFYAVADGVKKILAWCSPTTPVQSPLKPQPELTLGWETKTK